MQFLSKGAKWMIQKVAIGAKQATCRSSRANKKAIKLMGEGNGEDFVKWGLKCCTSTFSAAIVLVHCPCTHCCCPREEACSDNSCIYLPSAQERNKASLQPLPFLFLSWVVCGMFSFLPLPVIWPNPSFLVSGPQDLLGALNKARPSHGVHGRGAGERQSVHGEEWHWCQWGSFLAISELGMVGNANLMLDTNTDRTGRGRKGSSTYRYEQSN